MEAHTLTSPNVRTISSRHAYLIRNDRFTLVVAHFDRTASWPLRRSRKALLHIPGATDPLHVDIVSVVEGPPGAPLATRVIGLVDPATPAPAAASLHDRAVLDVAWG